MNWGVVVDLDPRRTVLRAAIVGDDVVDDSETDIHEVGITFLLILMYETGRTLEHARRRGLLQSEVQNN